MVDVERAERTRELLGGTVAAEQAFWEEKVAEEPDDDALVARRDAFEVLADHVAGLGDGDPTLSRLEAAVDPAAEVLVLGPVAREVLRGFRAEDPEEDPDAFLSRFAAALAP